MNNASVHSGTTTQGLFIVVGHGCWDFPTNYVQSFYCT